MAKGRLRRAECRLTTPRDAQLNRLRYVLIHASCIIAVAVLAYPRSAAWAWGNEGHQIVAIIAADNLGQAARAQVAKILGAANDTGSVESAMAAASLLPDTEFRVKDKSTIPWHFIDICLQDSKSEIPARCPAGACVTAKIDQYSSRLKDGNYDRWGAAGDLAFLIHFVGDIHQPLHAATDADLGGNCVRVEPQSWGPNLHLTWDLAVVSELEAGLGTRNDPIATARKLEAQYSAYKTTGGSWKPGEANAIAWESRQIAQSEIYAALVIPVAACAPDNRSCSGAPRKTMVLSQSYMKRAALIAGSQLAKAGFRLAGLLNSIWPTRSP